MQFHDIMEELLEHDDKCNISISFYKIGSRYSEEIVIKAYHDNDPMPFFVRRYFVEDASSPCFFYDYLSEKIQPFIENCSSKNYQISKPEGNVITPDNIHDPTEQTWNFSLFKIQQKIMA